MNMPMIAPKPISAPNSHSVRVTVQIEGKLDKSFFGNDEIEAKSIITLVKGMG